MRGRGTLLVAAVVVATAGATVAAARWPIPAAADLAVHGSRMTLPATGVAAIPICPGPETLLAPAGGQTVALAGPVAVGALLQADQGSSQGSSVGPMGTLGGTALVSPGGQVGLLTLGRTTAGSVALRSARTSSSPVMSLVQLGLTRTGDERGLAAAACSTASTQTWLVGGGTQPGRRGRLLLANPAVTPAVVDVTVHGPQGVVAAPGGSGIVVPAGGEVALLVDALAPDLKVVAVQVTTRSGRVAAVLRDTYVRGVTPGGVDDVTGAAPAARTQYVPGIAVAPASGTTLPAAADAPGAVAIRIANPGAAEAVARLHLLGPGGPVIPALSVVTVPAGSVVDVPVTDAPAGDYTAVVEADVPVLAGAVVGRTTPGGPLAGTPAGLGKTVPPSEFGWATSVEPLAGAALIALPALGESGGPASVGTQLTIGAPAAAATVQVTEFDDKGAAARTEPLAVAAGSTSVVTLGSGTAGVRITSAAGSTAPVVAALLLQVQDATGPMLSVLPVRPGPAGAGARPAVVADTRVGLR